MDKEFKVFEAKFKRLINEITDEAPVEDAPTPDAAAMAGTLDKDTDPAAFDVPTPEAEAERLTNQSAQQMFQQMHEWIAEIDRFVEYLNGTGPESMQSKLHAAGPDTVFEKVANAQTKKIARVAMELSALSEALKGYLVTSNDPKYRYI